MSYTEFRKVVQAPPIETQDIADGSRVEFYTADYEDGSMVWCRTIGISIYQGRIVGKKWLKGSNQQRCDTYTQISKANSESWTAFSNQTNHTLQNMNSGTESGGAQFCHYYDSGGKGPCYYSLSSCKSAIAGTGGFCTFEKE
jgi:hypothetical protein